MRCWTKSDFAVTYHFGHISSISELFLFKKGSKCAHFWVVSRRQPVQSGFWFFFSPMDWSFKHYRYLVCNESQFYHNFYGHYQNANLWLLRYLLGPIFSRESWENPKILVIINCCLLDGKYLTFSDQIPWCWCALPSVWRSGPIWFLASKMGNWQPQLVAD